MFDMRVISRVFVLAWLCLAAEQSKAAIDAHLSILSKRAGQEIFGAIEGTARSTPALHRAVSHLSLTSDSPSHRPDKVKKYWRWASHTYSSDDGKQTVVWKARPSVGEHVKAWEKAAKVGHDGPLKNVRAEAPGEEHTTGLPDLHNVYAKHSTPRLVAYAESHPTPAEGINTAPPRIDSSSKRPLEEAQPAHVEEEAATSNKAQRTAFQASPSSVRSAGREAQPNQTPPPDAHMLESERETVPVPVRSSKESAAAEHAHRLQQPPSESLGSTSEKSDSAASSRTSSSKSSAQNPNRRPRPSAELLALAHKAHPSVAEKLLQFAEAPGNYKMVLPAFVHQHHPELAQALIREHLATPAREFAQHDTDHASSSTRAHALQGVQSRLSATAAPDQGRMVHGNAPTHAHATPSPAPATLENLANGSRNNVPMEHTLAGAAPRSATKRPAQELDVVRSKTPRTQSTLPSSLSPGVVAFLRTKGSVQGASQAASSASLHKTISHRATGDESPAPVPRNVVRATTSKESALPLVAPSTDAPGSSHRFSDQQVDKMWRETINSIRHQNQAHNPRPPAVRPDASSSTAPPGTLRFHAQVSETIASQKARLANPFRPQAPAPRPGTQARPEHTAPNYHNVLRSPPSNPQIELLTQVRNLPARATDTVRPARPERMPSGSPAREAEQDADQNAEGAPSRQPASQRTPDEAPHNDKRDVLELSVQLLDKRASRLPPLTESFDDTSRLPSDLRSTIDLSGTERPHGSPLWGSGHVKKMASAWNSHLARIHSPSARQQPTLASELVVARPTDGGSSSSHSQRSSDQSRPMEISPSISPEQVVRTSPARQNEMRRLPSSSSGRQDESLDRSRRSLAAVADTLLGREEEQTYAPHQLVLRAPAPPASAEDGPAAAFLRPSVKQMVQAFENVASHGKKSLDAVRVPHVELGSQSSPLALPGPSAPHRTAAASQPAAHAELREVGIHHSRLVTSPPRAEAPSRSPPGSPERYSSTRHEVVDPALLTNSRRQNMRYVVSASPPVPAGGGIQTQQRAVSQPPLARHTTSDSSSDPLHTSDFMTTTQPSSSSSSSSSSSRGGPVRNRTASMSIHTSDFYTTSTSAGTSTSTSHPPSSGRAHPDGHADHASSSGRQRGPGLDLPDLNLGPGRAHTGSAGLRAINPPATPNDWLSLATPQGAPHPGSAAAKALPSVGESSHTPFSAPRGQPGSHPEEQRVVPLSDPDPSTSERQVFSSQPAEHLTIAQVQRPHVQHAEPIGNRKRKSGGEEEGPSRSLAQRHDGGAAVQHSEQHRAGTSMIDSSIAPRRSLRQRTTPQWLRSEDEASPVGQANAPQLRLGRGRPRKQTTSSAARSPQLERRSPELQRFSALALDGKARMFEQGESSKSKLDAVLACSKCGKLTCAECGEVLAQPKTRRTLGSAPEAAARKFRLATPIEIMAAKERQKGMQKLQRYAYAFEPNKPQPQMSTVVSTQRGAPYVGPNPHIVDYNKQVQTTDSKVRTPEATLAWLHAQSRAHALPLPRLTKATSQPRVRGTPLRPSSTGTILRKPNLRRKIPKPLERMPTIHEEWEYVPKHKQAIYRRGFPLRLPPHSPDPPVDPGLASLLHEMEQQDANQMSPRTRKEHLDALNQVRLSVHGMQHVPSHEVYELGHRLDVLGAERRNLAQLKQNHAQQEALFQQLAGDILGPGWQHGPAVAPTRLPSGISTADLAHHIHAKTGMNVADTDPDDLQRALQMSMEPDSPKHKRARSTESIERAFGAHSVGPQKAIVIKEGAHKATASGVTGHAEKTLQNPTDPKGKAPMLYVEKTGAAKRPRTDWEIANTAGSSGLTPEQKAADTAPRKPAAHSPTHSDQTMHIIPSPPSSRGSARSDETMHDQFSPSPDRTASSPGSSNTSWNVHDHQHKHQRRDIPARLVKRGPPSPLSPGAEVENFLHMMKGIDPSSMSPKSAAEHRATLRDLETQVAQIRGARHGGHGYPHEDDVPHLGSQRFALPLESPPGSPGMYSDPGEQLVRSPIHIVPQSDSAPGDVLLSPPRRDSLDHFATSPTPSRTKSSSRRISFDLNKSPKASDPELESTAESVGRSQRKRPAEWHNRNMLANSFLFGTRKLAGTVKKPKALTYSDHLTQAPYGDFHGEPAPLKPVKIGPPKTPSGQQAGLDPKKAKLKGPAVPPVKVKDAARAVESAPFRADTGFDVHGNPRSSRPVGSKSSPKQNSPLRAGSPRPAEELFSSPGASPNHRAFFSSLLSLPVYLREDPAGRGYVLHGAAHSSPSRTESSEIAPIHHLHRRSANPGRALRPSRAFLLMRRTVLLMTTALTPMATARRATIHRSKLPISSAQKFVTPPELARRWPGESEPFKALDEHLRPGKNKILRNAISKLTASFKGEKRVDRAATYPSSLARASMREHITPTRPAGVDGLSPRMPQAVRNGQTASNMQLGNSQDSVLSSFTSHFRYLNPYAPSIHTPKRVASMNSEHSIASRKQDGVKILETSMPHSPVSSRQTTRATQIELGSLAHEQGTAGTSTLQSGTGKGKQKMHKDLKLVSPSYTHREKPSDAEPAASPIDGFGQSGRWHHDPQPSWYAEQKWHLSHQARSVKATPRVKDDLSLPELEKRPGKRAPPNYPKPGWEHKVHPVGNTPARNSANTAVDRLRDASSRTALSEISPSSGPLASVVKKPIRVPRTEMFGAFHSVNTRRLLRRDIVAQEQRPMRGLGSRAIVPLSSALHLHEDFIPIEDVLVEESPEGIKESCHVPRPSSSDSASQFGRTLTRIKQKVKREDEKVKKSMCPEEVKGQEESSRTYMHPAPALTRILRRALPPPIEEGGQAQARKLSSSFAKEMSKIQFSFPAKRIGTSARYAGYKAEVHRATQISSRIDTSPEPIRGHRSTRTGNNDSQIFATPFSSQLKRNPTRLARARSPMKQIVPLMRIKETSRWPVESKWKKQKQHAQQTPTMASSSADKVALSSQPGLVQLQPTAALENVSSQGYQGRLTRQKSSMAGVASAAEQEQVVGAATTLTRMSSGH
ncbi:hypothetical protein CBOM_01050 [Ceraceosorus bombacis]|uniref:Uncharacterized protein n=1 Tax=Ceraceosorus bombacis TaxID=401625 RepID=A0A0P1BB96_9BASI|nr:hypothetical protein CBOM_01050 [Ceraceosorus bombacis]